MTQFTSIEGHADLAALARQHLPSEIAESWLALARPAFVLEESTDGPICGYRGGYPHLPAEFQWPLRPDGEPLVHVASFDCAALPVAQLDLPLPTEGTLSFFADESGAYGEGQVVYTPAGVPTVERPAPEDIEDETLERVEYTGRLWLTVPHCSSSILYRTFQPPDPFEGRYVGSTDEYDHPVWAKDFKRAAEDWKWSETRLLGGYAAAQQVKTPEDEAADNDLFEDGVETTDRWHLLAQLGDTVEDGWFYWFIRRQDLIARRFDKARFGSQRT